MPHRAVAQVHFLNSAGAKPSAEGGNKIQLYRDWLLDQEDKDARVHMAGRSIGRRISKVS
jgi:hypothetical protein